MVCRVKATIRNYQNFQKLFPNEEACFEYVFKNSCNVKCNMCAAGKRYRVSSRKCYACSRCGKQIHPLANTIFEKSSTSLALWFYAVFIITHAEKPVSARELERHLGVTYKTAWRMLKNIKTEMSSQERVRGADGFWMLLNHIVTPRPSTR
jgi:transposase